MLKETKFASHCHENSWRNSLLYARTSWTRASKLERAWKFQERIPRRKFGWEVYRGAFLRRISEINSAAVYCRVRSQSQENRATVEMGLKIGFPWKRLGAECFVKHIALLYLVDLVEFNIRKCLIRTDLCGIAIDFVEKTSLEFQMLDPSFLSLWRNGFTVPGLSWAECMLRVRIRFLPIQISHNILYKSVEEHKSSSK